MDEIFYFIPSSERLANSVATDTETAAYSNAHTWQSQTTRPSIAYQHDPALVSRFDNARATGLAELPPQVSASLNDSFVESIYDDSAWGISDEREVNQLLWCFVDLGRAAVKALFKHGHDTDNARTVVEVPRLHLRLQGEMNITVIAGGEYGTSPRLTTVAVEAKLPSAFISQSGVDGLTKRSRTLVPQEGTLKNAAAIAKKLFLQIMNAEQVRKAKNESNGHSLSASKESEARFGFLFCPTAAGSVLLISDVLSTYAPPSQEIHQTKDSKKRHPSCPSAASFLGYLLVALCQPLPGFVVARPAASLTLGSVPSTELKEEEGEEKEDFEEAET
ncbi:hypothetical protein T439DRAFT_355015 [Meredithblackwellia eburnea MCA 4105]